MTMAYSHGDAGKLYMGTRSPPYTTAYVDRHYSPAGLRNPTMSEREAESENTAPRKRIAVACSRCRKRKIRCSGDPGNGGACTNCKNASYEPCMFLRVHSTETQMKDNGYYGYDTDTARSYQSRSTISPPGSVSGYGTETATTDLLSSYRQPTFSYGSRGSSYYTPAISSWTASAAYPDDSVDYVNYNQYPILEQAPVQAVPGYSRYPAAKSVYVDPEVSNYNYSSLVHRPAQDSTTFTLSSMSASLPSTTERLPASDRAILQSSGSNTGTSRSVPDYTSKGYVPSSTSTITDGYASADFESPVAYSAAPVTLPSSDNVQHRAVIPSDTVDPLYTADYNYGSSSRDHSRRDSISSGSASIYPSDPNSGSALATPYALPPSSSASTSSTILARGSCGESMLALSGRGNSSHNSSTASSTTRHGQLHSVYDRPLGSVRGTA